MLKGYCSMIINNFSIARIVTRQTNQNHILITKLRRDKNYPEEKGILFFLIEIFSPKIPSKQIAKLIINTITESYFSNHSSQNPENRFEKALQTANRAIASQIPLEESEALNKMNAICILCHQSNLYISSCGNVPSYFFRNQVSSPLTDVESKEPDLLRAFSNITSGKIEPGDKIFIANSSFLDYIHFENIKKIISSYDPIFSINEMVQILVTQKANNVNCLTFEYLSESKKNFAPPSTLQDKIILNQIPSSWFQKNILSKKNKILPPKKIAKVFNKESGTNVFRKTIIFIGKIELGIWAFLVHIFSNAKKSRRDKVREQLNQKTRYVSPKIKSRKYGQKSIVLAILHGFYQSLANVISKFTALLKPERRKIIIAFFAVILIILILSAINNTRNNKNNNNNIGNAQNILAQAKEKYSQGQSSINNNKKDEGRNYFIESLQLLNQISQITQLKDDVNQLTLDVQSQIDVLNNIVRINNSQIVVDFDKIDANVNLDKINIVNNKFYTYSNDKDKIISSPIDKNEPKIASTINLPDQIISSTNTETELLFATSKNEIYNYSTIDGNFRKVDNAQNKWPTITTIQDYSNRLYVFSSQDKIINRYEISGAGFSKPKSILKDNTVKLNSVISMAIDGYIYLLNQDGTIVKLDQGKKISDFSLKNTPEPNAQIQNVKKIFTNQELLTFFIIDKGNNRIMEYDKEGYYKKQYCVDGNLGEIRDLAVQTQLKKLYILINNKVFAIDH